MLGLQACWETVNLNNGSSRERAGAERIWAWPFHLMGGINCKQLKLQSPKQSQQWGNLGAKALYIRIHPAGYPDCSVQRLSTSTLKSFNIKTFIWTGSCKHLDKCNFSLSGRTYFSNHLIFHLVSLSRSQSILFSHANMVIIQLIHRRGEGFAYRFSWWMLRLCYQSRGMKNTHGQTECVHTEILLF